MSIANLIKATLQAPSFVTKAYLEDLEDEHLFIRPTENANHIAWQLGHLIASEHSMVEMVFPNSMPPLPEGFAEKHSKEAAKIDDPSAFYTKADYLKVFDEQRTGTMAVLEKLSDDELEKPGPEKIKQLAPTVGAVFTAQATHYMMHAGQWVIVRRKLGKDPLF